jgi:hypothetical protein
MVSTHGNVFFKKIIPFFQVQLLMNNKDMEFLTYLQSLRKIFREAPESARIINSNKSDNNFVNFTPLKE